MKRLYSLLLILVLTLAFSASALAQDVNCGDLSAEDCELVVASQAAMAEISSGSSVIGVNAQVMDVPGVPYQNLTFDLTLDQTFSYDEDAMGVAMDLQMMSPQELADLYADPEQLSELMGQLVTGSAAEISLTMNASEELAMLLSTDPQMAFPESFALNLVLNEGILYVDTSTLGPLLGDQGLAGLSGWVGVEIVPLLQQSIMQSATDPATANAMAMSTASTSAAGGPLYGQIAAVDPMGAWLQFLNIERLEDEDVDGETTAVFSTTVDWEALLNSDYFGQLVGMSLMQSGAMPTQTDIDQTVQLARAFGPTVLQDLTLELIERVGAESAYLVSTEFVLDLDLSNILAMSGATGMEMPEDAQPTVNVVIETINTDLNEDLEIEAPSNAFVVPAQMLQQLMEGGM